MQPGIGSDLLRLLGVVVLVLVNGFFVAAEYALVSVRPTRVEELLQQGRAGARSVKRALDRLDLFIAATQLGVTVASLSLGWLGEPALSGLLDPVLSLLPAAWGGVASHTLSAIIAFVAITFLEVVVGELMPKTMALQRSESMALLVAQPMLLIELALRPFIMVINGAGNLLLRSLGLNPAIGHEPLHSEEELRLLVKASGAGGALEGSQSDMLDAVFDFGGQTASQAMVPRTEMIAVSAEAGLEDFIQTAIKHPFSKFPVYEATWITSWASRTSKTWCACSTTSGARPPCAGSSAKRCSCPTPSAWTTSCSSFAPAGSMWPSCSTSTAARPAW